MDKKELFPGDTPLTIVALRKGVPPFAGPLLDSDLECLAGESACFDGETTGCADIWLAGEGTSTFDVAWDLVAQGRLGPWGAVLCSRQQAGRGQMRRPWYSPPGNLYVSFLLPQDPLFKEEAAAVLVGSLLAQSLEGMGHCIFLKWPNDLVNAVPAKVGGLLLEERDGLVMAGLGLNLVSAPDYSHLRNEQSLPGALLSSCFRDGCGKNLAPLPLWCSLVSHAKIVYEFHVTGKLFSLLMQKADRFLTFKGRQVRLDDARVEYPCLCAGLGPGGGLVLVPRGGTAFEVFQGSVFLADS